MSIKNELKIGDTVRTKYRSKIDSQYFESKIVDIEEELNSIPLMNYNEHRTWKTVSIAYAICENGKHVPITALEVIRQGSCEQ